MSNLEKRLEVGKRERLNYLRKLIVDSYMNEDSEGYEQALIEIRSILSLNGDKKKSYKKKKPKK